MPLPDLFAASVARWPDALAVDVPPGHGRPARQQVTYAELARLAAVLGNALRPVVRGEAIVAILLPRDSVRLCAAQLAVLAVGAAYVCLDASFPDDYLEFVLRDASAVALLTDRAGASRCTGRVPPKARVFDVDEVLAGSAGAPAAAPRPPWLSAQSLAYVIYTSGTTGQPKGVLIEHRGIESLIRSGVERFGIGPGDRIAQGSSAAYDSSLEEAWLALAGGATVVLMDDATVRLGPDLAPWLAAERITVLCPPPTLLRAMDCRSPARELPQLRLCYAGGEAMPQDLCDVWARDLWLENGYGPTECTVTVVRGRLQRGEPVTIGRPVPGHDALLLDERLDEVAPGAPGELCLRGPGLARGYLGRAELTAERFPVHARFGRIYRTGDLVQTDAAGNLIYLGRIDAQVKVRGYRIELEAIEAQLCQCPGVREAACRVQGDGIAQSLFAWLVPADAGAPPLVAEVLAALRRQLPEYMVPAQIGIIGDLPRTIGGKLDRKALPALATAAPGEAAASGAGVALRDELEHRLAAAFERRLPAAAPVSVDADFFALGGDSLRAAQVITELRGRPDTAVLTVRDIYTARTIAGLAALVRERSERPGGALATEQRLRGRPLLVTAAQCVWLAAGLVASSAAGYGVAFELVPRVYDWLGPVAFLVVGPMLGVAGLLAYTALALWVAVLAKELLIGAYTPMRAPVWGGLYLRNWIVQRFARLVPWRLLQGTELHCMALRALGARIGKRVHLHRGVELLQGGWDLLELGDDVMVGQEVHLGIAELDAGCIVFGRVRIGTGATLDVRSGVASDTAVGKGALLAALSSLPMGGRVPANERWDGVPARPAGRQQAPPQLTVPGRQLPPLAHGLVLLALRLLGVPVVTWTFAALAAAFGALCGHDSGPTVAWLLDPFADVRSLVAALALAALAVPVTLTGQALLLRWSPPAPLGTSSRWALSYLRIWLRSGMLESAGIWLSGSLFWPAWLRLAGMQVGAKCEISTILDVLPEHVRIGAGSFLADGIYLGVPALQAGTVTVQPTVLGAGTFLGNHVVIHAGQQLPDDLLLGVCTVADSARMAKGSSWFGHPPFVLPRREVVTIDRRLTHDPSLLRYTNRVLWELLRLLLPLLAVAVGFAFWAVVEHVASTTTAAMFWWLWLPLCSLLAVGSLCAFVVALKWLLLGRVRPGQHALWSSWASRWDFLYVAWGFLARRWLTGLDGTLLLAWYARAMGTRVGRSVVLGPGFAQIVDPDMLTLDDGCTVEALFQAHSFEDRVLKIDRVHVGAGATVARGAVLLYGAAVGVGASVAPHSVVMKHEHLLPGQAYEGVPTAPAAVVPAPAIELPAAAAANGSATRDRALDLARGLAVMAMIWSHFVPAVGATTWPGEIAVFLAAQAEDKSAALFCLLAGMAWALHGNRADAATRPVGYVARRALALLGLGALFGYFVWPTEILMPLAWMFAGTMVLRRFGTSACLLTALAVVAAAPLMTVWLADYVEPDWLVEGSVPAVWSSFGWVTLRYFVFDGNYPLLPWLCFPLVGAAMVAVGTTAARTARWLWLALPLALAMQAWTNHAAGRADELGDLAVHLQSTWVPTSVPFVVQNLAWSVAIVALLAWWQARRSLAGLLQPLVLVGRASLTHYLLHLGLVFAPLRLWYPDEDWSIRFGVFATLLYFALAVPLTVLWFRHFRRGPLEGLLGAVSGRG